MDQEKSWTSTDPKVTVDFKPDDTSMVWYTYSTGFKAGGWQFANYFEETARQGFDPEELEMNEIGYKGSFVVDTLRLCAAAYTYDWTDKQFIMKRYFIKCKLINFCYKCIYGDNNSVTNYRFYIVSKYA